MLFSSPLFLYLFLPLTLLLFYFSDAKLKNGVLLFASLVFFAWGGVAYSIILVLSILVNYLFGYLVSRKKGSRAYLGLGVGINLGVLVVFKYADFIVANLNSLFENFQIKPIDQPNILLPIGISFFTFQAISYLIDVYRKEVVYQKNLVNLALYISLFPQLIAGPIVRYHDIASQLVKRDFSLEKFGEGVQRFIIGLSKKVLLANNFAIVADEILDSDFADLTTPVAWIGIVAYAFQIYFDFSGYSDMAIGLGKMFGFTILENFNFPYISKSIKEFWRRWHISLSTWFRDYLYIPLGGSRVSNSRTYFNLLIVFLLTGFWHGASWSFMFWGAFHGLFLVLERLGLDKLLRKTWQPVQHMYAMLVVLIGWVFFRVESIDEAFFYLKRMFVNNALLENNWLSYFDTKFTIVLFIGIISSTSFFPWIGSLYSKYLVQNRTINLASNTVYFLILNALLILSTFYLVAGSYNPFIYFRF
ncbi:MAG TPA: MBOAT family O-acyltransferase [Bacteroidales bacterium]